MIGRAIVVGIDPLTPEDEMVHVECGTADEAAAAVANLLLRGIPYVHVDNQAVLEARREALQEPL